MNFLGGRLLLLTGRVSTIEQGRETIRQTFQNGSALEKFRQMMIGQGVPANIAEQLTSKDETIVRSILKLGDVSHQAISSQTGFIQSIDSFKLGTIIQRLGMICSYRLRIFIRLIFSHRWWSVEINRYDRLYHWDSFIETCW